MHKFFSIDQSIFQSFTMYTWRNFIYKDQLSEELMTNYTSIIPQSLSCKSSVQNGQIHQWDLVKFQKLNQYLPHWNQTKLKQIILKWKKNLMTLHLMKLPPFIHSLFHSLRTRSYPTSTNLLSKLAWTLSKMNLIMINDSEPSILLWND